MEEYVERARAKEMQEAIHKAVDMAVREAKNKIRVSIAESFMDNIAKEISELVGNEVEWINPIDYDYNILSERGFFRSGGHRTGWFSLYDVALFEELKEREDNAIPSGTDTSKKQSGEETAHTGQSV